MSGCASESTRTSFELERFRFWAYALKCICLVKTADKVNLAGVYASVSVDCAKHGIYPSRHFTPDPALQNMLRTTDTLEGENFLVRDRSRTRFASSGSKLRSVASKGYSTAQQVVY